MTTALLIIDVQQGLCEGERRAHDSSEVIARINRVSEKACMAGVPVIFIQHELKAGNLEFGIPAWQLANGLKVEPGDIRVRKKTPGSFLKTDLEAILKSHGFTE
jgi:nicotinamidase-related amidase